MSIVPQSLFDKYDEFAQHFLDDFGVDCTLYYQESIEIVEPVNSDPIRQRKTLDISPSSNIFTRGDTSYRLIDQTESIRLRVYWTPEDLKRIGYIQYPAGSIAAYGLAADITKLNRAYKLEVRPNGVMNNIPWFFEKLAEPVMHGLTNKEFISFWKRING